MCHVVVPLPMKSGLLGKSGLSPVDRNAPEGNDGEDNVLVLAEDGAHGLLPLGGVGVRALLAAAERKRAAGARGHRAGTGHELGKVCYSASSHD